MYVCILGHAEARKQPRHWSLLSTSLRHGLLFTAPCSLQASGDCLVSTLYPVLVLLRFQAGATASDVSGFWEFDPRSLLLCSKTFAPRPFPHPINMCLMKQSNWRNRVSELGG